MMPHSASQTADLCAKAAASGLLPADGLLTVALSGGADSVALLLALHRLAIDQPAEFGYRLQAVHVHHGLRAAEADRDAEFCRALCARLRIPLQICRVDVKQAAARNRCSIETAARELRYAALAGAAPDGLLATAHHAGDQAETMLFRWLRGTALTGLCGIPPKRGRIIRPLLTATKAEILAFLAAEGQPYVTDSTNLLPDAMRNRLRQQIIPRLVAMNPAFLRHSTQLAASLSADAAYLSAQADAAYQAALLPSGGLRDLAALPTALRRRCLAKAIADCPICHMEPSFPLLARLERLLETGGSLAVNRKVTAQVSRGIFYLTSPPTVPDCETRIPMQIGENCGIAGRICRVEWVAAEPSLKIHNFFTKSTLDYDKIMGSPYFRQWTAADTICLPGRNFASSVRKCIQAAVPVPERRALFVLFDAQGPIFVERVGVAARVKPTADSRRVIRLDCPPIPIIKE